jgi:hypothetical protein
VVTIVLIVLAVVICMCLAVVFVRRKRQHAKVRLAFDAGAQPPNGVSTVPDNFISTNPAFNPTVEHPPDLPSRNGSLHSEVLASPTHSETAQHSTYSTAVPGQQAHYETPVLVSTPDPPHSNDEPTAAIDTGLPGDYETVEPEYGFIDHEHPVAPVPAGSNHARQSPLKPQDLASREQALRVPPAAQQQVHSSARGSAQIEFGFDEGDESQVPEDPVYGNVDGLDVASARRSSVSSQSSTESSQASAVAPRVSPRRNTGRSIERVRGSATREDGEAHAAFIRKRRDSAYETPASLSKDAEAKDTAYVTAAQLSHGTLVTPTQSSQGSVYADPGTCSSLPFPFFPSFF